MIIRHAKATNKRDYMQFTFYQLLRGAGSARLLLFLVVSIISLCHETLGQVQQPTSKPALSPSSASTSQSVSCAGWPFDANEAVRRQDEAAKSLGVDKEIELDFGNKLKMKLVLIPAGKFIMGSPPIDDLAGLELPQHEVTISKPFYMGIHHVTRGEFNSFVTDSGYKTDAETSGSAYILTENGGEKKKGYSWKNAGIEQTDDHPVVCVSRNDARAFCAWLSKKTGRTISLPTEAQWEYACRAGTSTLYNTGDSITTDQANFSGQSLSFGGKHGVFRKKTVLVGSFKPNAFGLYDMHGNAWQWCDDYLRKKAILKEPQNDPRGEDTPEWGVVRGGGWAELMRSLASSSVLTCGPSFASSYDGFRVICTDIPPAKAATQPTTLRTYSVTPIMSK